MKKIIIIIAVVLIFVLLGLYFVDTGEKYEGEIIPQPPALPEN